MTDKLDRLDDKIEKVLSAMDELKDDQREHSIILSRLTDTVVQHEQRSTTLEAATAPIIDHYHKIKLREEIEHERRKMAKEKREEFLAKAKYPVAIAAAIASSVSLISYIYNILQRIH